MSVENGIKFVQLLAEDSSARASAASMDREQMQAMTSIR
jgi:hypothetical protein